MGNDTLKIRYIKSRNALAVCIDLVEIISFSSFDVCKWMLKRVVSSMYVCSENQMHKVKSKRQQCKTSISVLCSNTVISQPGWPCQGLRLTSYSSIKFLPSLASLLNDRSSTPDLYGAQPLASTRRSKHRGNEWTLPIGIRAISTCNVLATRSISSNNLPKFPNASQMK